MASYNIFISHSWRYNDDYEKIKGFINRDFYNTYPDYSIPKSDPLLNANNATQIRQGIENHMRFASCVIVPAYVYATYSLWIQYELEIAKRMGKKIIAVIPWGAERTSVPVMEAAHKVVGWNADSIIDAIKY